MHVRVTWLLLPGPELAANNTVCHTNLTALPPISLNFWPPPPVLHVERTDNMFEWNFSSNAERLVAFLLVCALVVTALA